MSTSKKWFLYTLNKNTNRKKGIYNCECRIQGAELLLPHSCPTGSGIQCEDPRFLQGPLPTNSAREITPTTTLRSSRPVTASPLWWDVSEVYALSWASTMSLFSVWLLFWPLRPSWPTVGEYPRPDGLPSVGSHRVGHDWSDAAAAAAAGLAGP